MSGKLLTALIISIMLASITSGINKNQLKIKLKKNWQIQSSEKVKADGNEISEIGFSIKGWFPAEVPTTVLAALVRDSVYKNIFFSKNLGKIPHEQFTKPWWYRTEFSIPKIKNITTAKLEFNGINYYANIWLNGKQIAGSDTTKGSFRRFEINITNDAKFGSKNVLAVEIIPPKKGDPTIGFVDWNPEPPDSNMGLWRGVNLKLSGDISINYPFRYARFSYPRYFRKPPGAWATAARMEAWARS